MKKTTLTIALALSLSAPAVTLAGGNCEIGNAKLSSAQRTAYLKQCLAESSAPANIKRVAQQQKKASCEQNARNLALKGNAKTDYVAKCMVENEARDAMEAQSAASLQRNYSANDSVTTVR